VADRNESPLANVIEQQLFFSRVINFGLVQFGKKFVVQKWADSIRSVMDVHLSVVS